MKLVYLDQNQWIYLAKAFNGVDERFKDALQVARQARRLGIARFPLSLVHCMEVHKIGGEDRRRRLAEFMLDLSGGWFIAPQSSVLRVEVANATSRFFGIPREPETVKVLGRGLVFAFGAEGWPPGESGLTPEELHNFGIASDDRELLLQYMVGESADSARQLREVHLELCSNYSRPIGGTRLTRGRCRATK